MAPGTYPMRLRRNAPEPVRLTLKARDDAGNLIPWDLTGCSLVLQVRLYGGAVGVPLLSVSTDTGEISIEDAENGIAEIDWSAIKPAIDALPSSAEPGNPDTFFYDLLAVAGDGTAQAILEGPVPVVPGVTIHD